MLFFSGLILRLLGQRENDILTRSGSLSVSGCYSGEMCVTVYSFLSLTPGVILLYAPISLRII